MSLVGSVSPNLTPGDDAATLLPQDGETEPTRPLDLAQIKDPELAAAFMAAHYAWAKRHAPWLLKEWLA